MKEPLPNANRHHHLRHQQQQQLLLLPHPRPHCIFLLTKAQTTTMTPTTPTRTPPPFKTHRQLPTNQRHQVHSQKHEAEVNGGASGRHSLVSLLLAMEAHYFVVTTGSNWSRLIDELRRTILDR
jgi:hypothetical protein